MRWARREEECPGAPHASVALSRSSRRIAFIFCRAEKVSCATRTARARAREREEAIRPAT